VVPLALTGPSAQPVVVVADHADGMDADRGHDGQYRRQGLEVKRREAIARILRLTDPVHQSRCPPARST
jgi:hypothetical protein